MLIITESIRKPHRVLSVIYPSKGETHHASLNKCGRRFELYQRGSDW
jgi:hypothetical protein